MKITLSVFLMLSFALLISCGGGSGDSSSSQNNNNQNIGGDSSSLNANIEGKLFFEYQDSAYLMDISSGAYTLIPNTDWDEQNNRLPSGDCAIFCNILF